MSDLIRKAVELAGWEYDDNTLTGKAFIALPKTDAQVKHGTLEHWREANDQITLDALAAQLVRQVDALDPPAFELDISSCSTRLWVPSNDEIDYVELSRDRTMNTLKAIIESGVLEQSDE